MQVTLLGTGSPLPSARRASTGHVVEIGRDAIMIDVGPGTMDRLLASGRQPTAITHVVLSHLHFDHIGDLGRLLFYGWDSRAGIGALPIVAGPAGTQAMIDALFGRDGAYANDLRARTQHPRSLEIYRARGGALPRPWPAFDIREYVTGVIFDEAAWRLSAHPVHHHQPFLESFGVRIETADGVIAYSSDIEIDDAGYAGQIAAVAQDADLLIHYLNEFAFDAGPSKATELGRAATRCGVKVLVTTHHGPAMDRDDTPTRICAAIASTFSGRVVYGKDLLSFRLVDGVVTGADSSLS